MLAIFAGLQCFFNRVAFVLVISMIGNGVVGGLWMSLGLWRCGWQTRRASTHGFRGSKTAELSESTGSSMTPAF
jgi:hypothetical protein